MFSEKLDQIMLIKGVSNSQLSKMTGISENTIKNMRYKGFEPKFENVIKISESLECTLDFLAGKKKVENEQIYLLDLYNKLGNHGKKFITAMAEREVEMMEKNKTKNSKMVSVIKPFGNLVDGLILNSCERYEVEVNSLKDDIFMGIEMQTDSFSPSYCRGDIILLEKVFPKTNDVAVFDYKGKYYFRYCIKKGSQYILKPINNANGEDIIFDNLNDLKLLGTCVDVVRN